jgi:hypothetical protein
MENKRKSIDDVETIYRHIATIGNITISHKVVVYKSPPKGSNKPQQYANSQCSKITLPGRMGVPSYYMRETKDYITLTEGFGKYDDANKKNMIKTRKKAYVSLTYPDIANVRQIFDNAYNWFTLEEYRNNLFKYDKSGVPYGISSQYEGLSTLTNIVTGTGNFLSIQPTVLLDALNSIGYPGVVFKGCNGVLGECTVGEFMSLRRIIFTLLDNLYQNSLILLNHFLMLETHGGNQDNYVIY